MQRGGGNMAKALAEIAECGNASGFDVRGFCAGPVASVITAASMAACGARANVAVVSGGSVPKLYMNARDHVKKDVKALENCIGSFALLITPDDGRRRLSASTLWASIPSARAQLLRPSLPL